MVAPDQVVRDLAVGDRLGRDRDAARGDAGRGRAVGAVGEAVGAPVAHAVDVDADPDVLPGHVAEPAATGPDDDRHGIRGLGAHLEDAAAQVGAGAQRVDQVEVVAGHERGGQGLGHLAGPTQRRPRGVRGRGLRAAGATAPAGAPSAAARRAWSVGRRWRCSLRQRNLRDRNLRNRNHNFPARCGNLHVRTTTVPARR